MTKVAEVFEYIDACVGDHKFGSYTSMTNHRLYRSTIDSELELMCSNGRSVTIPEGSELVVYRRPGRVASRTVAIACFHHPDKDTQTVIYASGRVSVKKESARSLYDYGAQYRQSSTLQTYN